MKKVLWLMALLLTSMTISAEDLWVRGLNGSWANTDANKLTLVEGTTDQYILADFTITQTCKFVIANSDYTTKYARWDEYGTEINADNLSLKLGPNGGDVACNVTGTFDIKFDMSNTTVTFVSKGEIVTPDPVITYGIHGQFTGNSWSTTNMTEDADGNWICTITPTNATGSFGIQRLNNGNQVGWLNCSAATELSESNATIDVSLTGSNNPTFSLTTGRAYTFTFNPTDGNLTITWSSEPTPDPVVTYGVHGQFTDTNWSTANMTEDTDGNWICTITPTNATGAFGIKMMLDGEQPSSGGWFRCSEATELSESNATINVAASGNTDPTYALTTGKAYTFTFNPTDGNLTITWATTPDPEPVVSYGVHGQFTNSEWSTTDMTKDADGNWTCTITPTIADGSFGIRRYVNGTIPETDNWLRCAEATELSESNATINVALTGSKNPTYALTTGKAYTFTFDPTDGSLTITWATTPDPEPVVTPETLYLRGNINATGWTPSNAMAMTKDGNTFTVSSDIVDTDNGYGYFSFSVANGTAEDDAASDWDTHVNSADRYGAATGADVVALGSDIEVVKYAVGVNASSCASWKIAAGTGYTFTVTFTAEGATLKVTQGTTPDPDPEYAPETLYIRGNINATGWTPSNAVAMTKDGNVFTVSSDIVDTDNGYGYFSFSVANGTAEDDAASDWDTNVNSADRFGAATGADVVALGSDIEVVKYAVGVNASSCASWKIAAGTGYTFTVTFTAEGATLKVTQGTTPDPDPEYAPETLYLRGNINATGWTPSNAVAMTKDGNTFTVSSDIVDTDNGYGYFSFSVANGTAEDDAASDWDTNVNSADRYGAATGADVVALGSDIEVVKYAVGVNASSCASWKIAAGTGYTFTVTFTAEGATLKVTQGTTPDPDPEYAPEALYLRGNINATGWTPSNAVAMTKDGNVFTVSSDIVDTDNGYGYFSFSVANGTAEDDAASDWDTNVNSADRYGAATGADVVALGSDIEVVKYAVGVNASSCASWKIAAGTGYTFTVIFTAEGATLKVTQGTTPDPDPEYAPETLYIRGNINATGWTPSNAVAMTKDGNTFTVTSSVANVNEGYGYISFSVANGTAEDDAANDWDTNVNSADRFGPAVGDTEAAFDTDMPVTTYAAGVNASACTSWKVKTGTNMTFIVTFTADGATLKITDFVGVEDITLGAADDVQYYNLQGARVVNPAAGIYIEVRGTTARKVAIK